MIRKIRTMIGVKIVRLGLWVIASGEWEANTIDVTYTPFDAEEGS